jgi:hypothetical protein
MPCVHPKLQLFRRENIIADAYNIHIISKFIIIFHRCGEVVCATGTLYKMPNCLSLGQSACACHASCRRPTRVHRLLDSKSQTGRRTSAGRIMNEHRPLLASPPVVDPRPTVDGWQDTCIHPSEDPRRLGTQSKSDKNDRLARL